MKTLIQRLLLKLGLVDLRFIQEHFLKVETNIEAGDLVCPVMHEDRVYEAVGIVYTPDLEPRLMIKDVNGPGSYTARVYEFKRAPVVTNVDFPIF